jgi:hypothetical protein
LNPAAAAPAAEGAAPATAAAAPAGGKVEPTPAQEPPEATLEPTQPPDSCRKTLADLGAGDRSALELFPPQKRAQILGAPAGMRLVACLAIAQDDSRFCDALPDERKIECLQDREVMGELKSLPKEGVKGYLIHRLCVQGSPQAECDKIKAAIDTRDAARCKGLADSAFQAFCEALASGDVKKCDPLPRDASKGPDRGLCAAYTTDDSSHCRKDSPDCIKLAKTFATAKKEGLEGFATSDPAVAAARQGKAACAPLVKELESLCAGGAK